MLCKLVANDVLPSRSQGPRFEEVWIELLVIHFPIYLSALGSIAYAFATSRYLCGAHARMWTASRWHGLLVHHPK